MTNGDKIKLNQETPIISYTKSLIPILWEFLEKQRGIYSISVNLVTLEDEVIISLINRKKVKRFRIPNNSYAIDNLRACLKF
jgi:hypothetical protein